MIVPSKSFELASEEYERTRPDYPAAVLDLLPLGPESEVLDLAAGTGKLTRVLVRRYRRVVAVEPLDKMRSVLERVVPEAEALAGTAEAIPLGDASVDAVFAAQAFHWFDHARAVPEIARVLRPGGVFAIVWNGPDEARPDPFPERYRAYLDELHAPSWKALNEQRPWEEQLADTKLFASVHERTSVPHDHILDRQGLIDNARSVSWIASRADSEEVIERLGTLLPEGIYSIPNLANVLWAVRA